jgi:hypothetical protein
MKTVAVAVAVVGVVAVALKEMASKMAFQRKPNKTELNHLSLMKIQIPQ